ncbi:hypothetical protein QTP70_024806 [Hemibagrus guttatus]|uniref:Uncharacterized protein n=1 Tax=Hemibagrus guttatus TaxID=175788 RepID=A0AAE0VCA1_9TELE|nr:hypothetical protein QTP70_024806 [Hemibagrus guttatus]KAK3570594.1 hypothetical protein QTP86_023648 [Hemibagrus guttatus]
MECDHFCDVFSPFCRAAHDISLEEFDDEDLSEITDDCGIGLNYDSDPYEKWLWAVTAAVEETDDPIL